MTKRDFKAQYRQSLLGFFWAFAPILANSLVWIFLQKSGTVNLQETGIPYPLYVIIGTTLWTIFIESLQNPINSVNGGKSILSKINFPKEALIISGIYTQLINMALKFILVVLLMVIYSEFPGTSFIFFPLILVTIMAFGISIGLIITPIGLLYSDIVRGINFASSFLMYITPVLYMMPKAGIFKTLFEINPLTYLINDGRNSLVGENISHLDITLVILLLSLLLMAVGLVIFRKSMPIIIEKIS